MKLRSCLKHPLKNFVILEVLKELEIKYKGLEVNINKFANPNQEYLFYLPINDKQFPDMQWLLNVLSTLNMKHYFLRNITILLKRNLQEKAKFLGKSFRNPILFMKTCLITFPRSIITFLLQFKLEFLKSCKYQIRNLRLK